MNRINLTASIRATLSHDPRAAYDEAHLLLCVYEQHGLSLTPAQKSVIADLPSPASVVRIANREKKRHKENKIS